jgi:hypothetical protein
MTWPPRNYRRFDISLPFFCVQEDDVASQEVQKCQISHHFFCVTGDDVASRKYRRCRYLILSFACEKMPWPPMKFRRFEISHPFFCLREDAVASQEVQKVHDITSFLLRAGR